MLKALPNCLGLVASNWTQCVERQWKVEENSSMMLNSPWTIKCLESRNNLWFYFILLKKSRNQLWFFVISQTKYNCVQVFFNFRHSGNSQIEEKKKHDFFFRKYRYIRKPFEFQTFTLWNKKSWTIFMFQCSRFLQQP